MLGLYRDDGKENGNYDITTGIFWGLGLFSFWVFFCGCKLCYIGECMHWVSMCGDHRLRFYCI